jgi:hypothetical protein
MEQMIPGFYVMRRAHLGKRLMLESRCFKPMPEKNISLEWTKDQAESWADYVRSEHPKDDVFVMEVLERPTR